jgi:hypothetical protein
MTEPEEVLAVAAADANEATVEAVALGEPTSAAGDRFVLERDESDEGYVVVDVPLDRVARFRSEELACSAQAMLLARGEASMVWPLLVWEGRWES